MSGANGKIRGLILDYGEVLCHKPAPEKFARLAACIGLDPETFAVRYFQERDLYDRGDLTPEVYWSRVAPKGTTISGEVLATMRKWDVEMWTDVNREMTEWIDEARAAGLKVAILSNMHIDMAHHARRSFDWLHRMDHLTLSCEVRLAKPERAIFENCVNGLGLNPAETCFIDDREANVKAAREAGLKALQFRSVADLRNDLADLGVPVLPKA